MNDQDNLRLSTILKDRGYVEQPNGIFSSGRAGYWSNLDKDENQEFLTRLGSRTPLEAVREMFPHLEQIIFSEKREAALELLDISENALAIDYGCMWGGLSVGLARRGASVLALDQTLESLEFLGARKRHEGLSNLVCVQDDIRESDFRGLADIAIVNGVLEWIPEFGDIELKKYYGKRQERSKKAIDPENLQKGFLSRVYDNLNDSGQMLLAIENRYDYGQFFGNKDPHSNLFLTSIVPRGVANMISRYKLDRPYVNYLYSFPEMKKILLNIGFREVDLYMAFPGYHFPELLMPYGTDFDGYRKYCSWQDVSIKGKIGYLLEYTLMKFFKACYFAPAIVAVAKK